MSAVSPGEAAAGPATGSARVGVDARDGHVLLEVLGRRGQVLHRDGVVVDGSDASDASGGPGDGDERVLAAADDALLAAGWVRAGGWRPLPAGEAAAGPGPHDDESSPTPGTTRWRVWTTGTAVLPRTPLDGAGLRALDTLGYLTRVARGPVTVGALVPHAAPSRRLAAVLVRRLVAAGHARAVGRTAGSRPQALYAPVGSPWAPAREEP